MQHLHPGERIGDYTIVSWIGEGGMSEVYLAEDGAGDRVVVKRLKEQHRHDSQLVERFIRGADILQELRHPHLARVYACFEHGGQFVMVEEHLSGGSLANLIDEHRPYSEEEALRWCRDALRALDYAHQYAIVHRDLKPSNLMLDARRQVKVIDFGIARVFGEARITQMRDAAPGTLAYMSPEQILDPDEVRHQTDVYSMGIVLYELLSGDVPFKGKTDFEIKKNITSRPAPPIKRRAPGMAPMNPRKAGLDPRVAKIVMQAIEKSTEQRLGGCRDFALELEEVLNRRGRRVAGASASQRGGHAGFASWRKVAGAALLLVLLIAVWRTAGSWQGAAVPPPAASAPLPPPEAPAAAPSVPERPGIRLMKDASPAAVRTAGTPVTYKYTVTNSGNVPLRNVTITDEGANPSFRSGDENGDSLLDVGESWVYDAKVTITQAVLDRGGSLRTTAFASADGVRSEPQSAVVALARQEPAVEIATLVNGVRSLDLKAPEPLTFTYAVSNVGNVVLTGVRVTDRPGVTPVLDTGDANGNNVLDPGETWHYRSNVAISQNQFDTTSSFVSRAVAVSNQARSEQAVATVQFVHPPVQPLRLITVPAKTKNVLPQYPAEAQAAGVRGTVKLDVTVGLDGRVEDVQGVESVAGLDQAALDAAKQWEYSPTVRDGVRRRVTFPVNVEFKLTPPPPPPPPPPVPEPPPPQPPPSPAKETLVQTKRVEPQYPRGVQGTVKFVMTVGTNGRVQKVEIVESTNRRMNQAVVDAVKQWEFEPVEAPVDLRGTATSRPNNR